MRFVECKNCFEQVEAKDFYKEDSGWCCTCPKCKATIKIRDIENFLLPPGTKIEISDGRLGVVDGYANTLANQFEEIEYRIRLTNENDMNNIIVLSSRHFKTTHNWRLTEKTTSRIVKVCHYPKNRDYSNAPCYNCADSSKCFFDILERLAEYEDTGLLPEEIKDLKSAKKENN